MNKGSVIEESVSELLKAAGYSGALRIEPLESGGNNRVFRVCRDGRDFLAKSYFHDADDSRDRGGAEYRFSRFVWQAGITSIPEPIGYLPQTRVGVYAFVPGKKLTPGELQSKHIEQAIEFVLSINRVADFGLFPAQWCASESCFSLSQHLAVLKNRIRRLQQYLDPEESPEAAAAHRLVVDGLVPVQDRVSKALVNWASKVGLALDQELPPNQRCLSPSDFGFHNVIVGPSSQLTFIDFEYAGWDDPAKMLGDFFCQPEVPIGRAYFDHFRERCAEFFDDSLLVHRTEQLIPLYQLKWCSIMLNEFLPAGSRRRAFAGHDIEQRRKNQLSKVEFLLSRMVI